MLQVQSMVVQRFRDHKRTKLTRALCSRPRRFDTSPAPQTQSLERTQRNTGQILPVIKFSWAVGLRVQSCGFRIYGGRKLELQTFLTRAQMGRMGLRFPFSSKCAR